MCSIRSHRGKTLRCKWGVVGCVISCYDFSSVHWNVTCLESSNLCVIYRWAGSCHHFCYLVYSVTSWHLAARPWGLPRQCHHPWDIRLYSDPDQTFTDTLPWPTYTIPDTETINKVLSHHPTYQNHQNYTDSSSSTPHTPLTTTSPPFSQRTNHKRLPLRGSNTIT